MQAPQFGHYRLDELIGRGDGADGRAYVATARCVEVLDVSGM